MRKTTQTSTNHTSSLKSQRPLTRPALDQIAEARTEFFEAYGVLKCLYHALLQCEADDAALYADATRAAMRLIDEAAERLDSVNIGRLIESP